MASKSLHAVIPVRFQARVKKMSDDAWAWIMDRGDGESYESNEWYSSEEAAYEAARHELILLKKEIKEDNEKIKVGPWPTPGEILQEEFLNPMGISHKELADGIGTSPETIDAIVAGNLEIDYRLAAKLGEFFKNI